MKPLILFSSMLLTCQLLFSQNWMYNRLTNIDQNKPEKIEKVAARYTKLFPKKPEAYFFLAKMHFDHFENAEEDKQKSKSIYECLKLASKTQELDKKAKVTERAEWARFKEDVKRETFFYTKETSYTRDLRRLKKKLYSFVSLGEKDFLLESELGLKVPEEERIDSLFYELPTGKEYVRRLFPDEELKMLHLINEEREQMGLSKMTLDSSLSAACRYHAYDMGTQNYVGHMGYDIGADGRMYVANYTFDRIRKFYNQTRVLGENISLGREKAYYTYKGWYNSSAHYKIMFKPENRLVGIGLVYVEGSDKEFYWVLCTAE